MDSPTLARSKYYRRISYDFPAHHIPSVLTCLSGIQPPVSSDKVYRHSLPPPWMFALSGT